jgi:hypothetical protein
VSREKIATGQSQNRTFYGVAMRPGAVEREVLAELQRQVPSLRIIEVVPDPDNPIDDLLPNESIRKHVSIVSAFV